MLKENLSLVFALLGLSACAPAAPSPAPVAAAQSADAVAEVTRDGDAWTAVYRLPREAAAWAFVRSSRIQETREPWRPSQWRPLTPGLVLERFGEFDVMHMNDGSRVPAEVRFAFTPRHDNLEADYSTLVFTDGSVALPSGIFDIFPLDDLRAASDVPADLDGYEGEVGDTRVTWRDTDGPVLFRGERVDAPAEANADTYVLFGQAQVTVGERLVTVTDPQSPPWIVSTLEDFAPRVADYYSARLGPAGGGSRPMVMVSWGGPTPGRTSMNGSVMPGLIVMTFEGDGVVAETPDMLSQTRWFIGHEQGHFWLGQTVRYETRRDAWITEGGADLMAVRALQTLDPGYDARRELQREVDDCIRYVGRPVAEAASRGENRADYACGAVFALVAEAAQRRTDGGDWFDFLRPLIDASREDGTLTRDAWLTALSRTSGDPALAQDIAVLLDVGAEDGALAIGRLLRRADVDHHIEQGRPVLH